MEKDKFMELFNDAAEIVYVANFKLRQDPSNEGDWGFPERYYRLEYSGATEYIKIVKVIPDDCFIYQVCLESEDAYNKFREILNRIVLEEGLCK